MVLPNRIELSTSPVARLKAVEEDLRRRRHRSTSGGSPLTSSLVIAVATVGTANNQPFASMEHVVIAVSIVAAAAAVALDVLNAGVLFGIFVTFLRIPLAPLPGFFLLFTPSRRGRRFPSRDQSQAAA